MNGDSKFSRVLDTLLCESSSLKIIAERSGIDVFKFYQAASLTELDLRQQDLRGLSFDGADFRGSNLDAVSYDCGAFNNSIIDVKFDKLRDNFEFYIDDIFAANRYGLHFYGKFRKKSLELAINKTGLTYSELADDCNIAVDTLRRARNNYVMAKSTILSICEALMEGWEAAGFNDINSEDSRLRQPFIDFLDLTPNGKFIHIPKREFLKTFRSQITDEIESGPQKPPDSSSTFAIQKWLSENYLLIFQH